mmetsp:Transcript_20245/g.49655  ORF Transcript_20245/g.49655 Transcript_20245/m.49655 type:complete len:81 (-) Transcript_20245:819-1061(-)
MIVPSQAVDYAWAKSMDHFEWEAVPIVVGRKSGNVVLKTASVLDVVGENLLVPSLVLDDDMGSIGTAAALRHAWMSMVRA